MIDRVIKVKSKLFSQEQKNVTFYDVDNVKQVFQLNSTKIYLFQAKYSIWIKHFFL